MWPLRAGTFLNFLLHIPHSTGFPDSVPFPDEGTEDDVGPLSKDFCRWNVLVEIVELLTGPFGGLCTAASAFAATRDTDEIESPTFVETKLELVLIFFV